MKPKVSYAQNAEDIRVWRAFDSIGLAGPGLTYVDVGANEPRHLSITASLSDLGWAGILIEADPEHASELRVHRPGDRVEEVAAASGPGELVFFRVPGTGLGTLDAHEAEVARGRGFEVEEVRIRTEALDDLLARINVGEVHFMSIDVEGAEATVLSGLSLDRFRPWAICVEAVLPGTTTPSHQEWEAHLTSHRYRGVAFDGVNRWYVAEEHADLADALAIPFNAVDAGAYGWVIADQFELQKSADRALARRAWQRELILNDIRHEVPKEEYERQIHELRSTLIAIEGSRVHRYTRKVGRKAKGAIFRAKSLTSKMPGPVRKSIVRKRHLKHVTVNMGHLTPPALMGNCGPDALNWITPEGLPDLPSAGLDLSHFDAADSLVVREWLAAGSFDTDALLSRRIDNHGDELGRLISALRLRLALTDKPLYPLQARGNQVLFDARSLQSPAFGNRGIGRFAKSALIGVRAALGDDRIVLLVDRGLEELPAELAGTCSQVTRVTERTVCRYSVLIEPSPMTADAWPLTPLLHSDAHKIAIVFDFIPMHWPTLYLGNAAARAEYAAALDALNLYDDFLCISHLVEKELAGILGGPPKGNRTIDSAVAWPRDVLPTGESAPMGNASGPIVVMTGDDVRKNTFGALAAIGAATSEDETREVVVLGMAGQGTRVHHWSIAAAMRPGEARTAERISDTEMHELLANAALVVVPSFDEGLSLPVIEALRAGAPVVASDIPSHRELIGSGSYLADPKSPAAMSKAIRRHLRRASTCKKQRARLRSHSHLLLEDAVAQRVQAHVASMPVQPATAQGYDSTRPLRVAVAGTWSPQRTGVADYTAATITELARLAEVTVFATVDADVAAGLPADVRIAQRPFDELYERADEFDVVVAITGNSHFHLPMLRLLEEIDAVVITHDTRLVELYLSLRDRGGVEHLMLRGTGQRALEPALDEQITDMRLLQNMAYWEVARRARLLIAHTPTAQPRIQAETGCEVRLLPFANYRSPEEPVITPQMRADARARLGFDDSIHLASFGFIDTRTKMTDVVLEAVAWLSQWGHRVSLHLVGAATQPVQDELMARARESGVHFVEITGFVNDETFRDYVLACDLGVQLRISPLLGVSGPLSDMAAYGTPAVASTGLAVDVDAPAFVDRLPDDVSPVMVAEAIEYRVQHPWSAEEIERMRVEYIAAKSPAVYAQHLLAVLEDVATHPMRGEG